MKPIEIGENELFLLIFSHTLELFKKFVHDFFLHNNKNKPKFNVSKIDPFIGSNHDIEWFFC